MHSDIDSHRTGDINIDRGLHMYWDEDVDRDMYRHRDWDIHMKSDNDMDKGMRLE